MELLERINNDLKEAMKSKNTVALDSLRAIKSAINYKKAETGKDPGEEDILAAIAKEAKKRKDSIAQFKDAGRDDLAEREEAQLAVIESFLPAALGDDEIEAVAKEIIAKTGARSKKDMGKVMGQVMAAVKGQADGNRVKNIVMNLLD